MTGGLSHWWARTANRWAARALGRSRPVTGFVSQPEPRSMGAFARGRQLIAGNLMFAGFLVEAPGVSLWDVDPPDLAFTEDIHGFAWLDDLAAVPEPTARARAQEWTHGWVSRHGRGKGPGWTPDLTGRRIIRMVNHAPMLLMARGAADQTAFFQCLGRQVLFLSRRWPAAAPGLPRFEALVGLVHAGLALTGMEARVPPALKALDRECREQIDIEGGLPTRNPEELLEVFTLLVWACQALTEAGRMPGGDLRAAVERIAPTLRALRHADGGLARFHGGGRGGEGRLDRALASASVRAGPPAGLAMGFVRLAGGRTTVIADVAPPPMGRASAGAHASTLAFEMTSGRRPVVVNCGSGVSFGTEWRRAGRATPSHSTLGVEGWSSSRLGAARMVAGHEREYLSETPRDVRMQIESEGTATVLTAGHDGWLRSHGLTHVRRLALSGDGRLLSGEDTLAAVQEADRKRFDAALSRGRLQGLPFVVRFHLHPDVEASLDLGGRAVSLALKSGEIWVFRHDGEGRLGLEPSVYLERARLKPRAAQQVVLAALALEQATRLRWTLQKAQDTPLAIRDLAPDSAGDGASDWAGETD
jgi:uncharacterized heparinase superfamily protein